MQDHLFLKLIKTQHGPSFGFNVSDKIIIEIENNNLIEKAIFENIDYIKNETLAVELSFKETLINTQEVEFDNINIKIKIKKI